MEHAPHRGIDRLVRDARQGDQCAWTALVNRYAGLVCAVARAHRLNEADAADVSQATWIKLFRSLDRLHNPAALGAWLSTTAKRESLRCIQRGGRTEPWPDEHEPADAGPAVDSELLAGERDALVVRALGELSGRDQALLRMLAAEPAPSYDEIGAALDMPVGSIGPTRARALERLRRKLAQLGTPVETLL